MSVVIIGGNERMEQQYKQICKRYKCKAKVLSSANALERVLEECC